MQATPKDHAEEMISKYPLKHYKNIKRELRIKTLTEIAIRDGLPSAKEYCIKNLQLSENSWEHTYKPRIVENMKKPELLTTPFDTRVTWKKASELKK